MGSMIGSVLARRATRQFTRAQPSSSLRTGRVQCVGLDHARHPHHVENPRSEAEQQKHDHSPRRDSKQLVENPPDAGADQDPGDKLGRQPETTGDRRGVAGRSGTWTTIGRTAGTKMAEPFAETLGPRGERCLVGRWLSAITFFARVVGHAFDTRDRSGRIAAVPPPPKGARTILTGSG